MTLPVEVNPLMMKFKSKYNILRSLRFRPNAYLRRLFTTPTNATTWTLSMWFKRGDLGRQQQLMGVYSTNPSTFGFNASDQFYMRSNAVVVATSTAVYRDPNAWYHLVVISNGTSVYAYINNIVSCNYAGPISLFNTAINHSIGRNDFGAEYFNGYMTEITFVDGQYLSPTSFGQYDDVTFTWEPIAYIGTLGNNGFFLNFYDASATTATTLGKDQSGGGKNFTPTGFSLTAGTTYDSAYDTPSLTPNTLYNNGNYCTLNSLDLPGTTGAVTNGGQDGNLPVDGSRTLVGTMPISSGQWYWEVLCTSLNTLQMYGIVPATYSCKTSTQFAYQIANSVHYASSGLKYLGGTGTAYGSGWAANSDTIGVALDMNNSQITFYKNGVAQPTLSITAGVTYVPSFASGSTAADQTFSVNFGQKTFTYAPPSGFKALNAYNLPDALIMRPALYMDAKAYTGTGTTVSVQNTAGFQPDLVWIKGRSAATSHAIYDSVRGVQLDFASDTSAAETTQSTGLTAFGARGFTVQSLAKVNTSAATYISWHWKKGLTPGLDIVTYTGNGTNRTIAHSLGVAPNMVIVKKRSGTIANGSSDAVVWHSNMTSAAYLMYLDGVNAETSTPTAWNSTAPTSSVFSVGTNTLTNENTATYVAYLFAEVNNFSKFGKYVGNGVADGPFVNCGFRPVFVMFKRTSTNASGGNWIMKDSIRPNTNAANLGVYANLANAEGTDYVVDFLSNGFKIRDTNVDINGSALNYVYVAFSDNPFKYTLAR